MHRRTHIGMVILSLALQATGSLAASGSPASKLKRLSCRDSNAQAVLVVGATENSVSDANQAASMTHDLIDVALFCVVVDSSKRIQSVEIVNGEDPRADRFLSIGDFINRGYQNYQSFPVFGSILVTDLRCPSCQLTLESYPLRFAVLHSYSLIGGQAKSDYRNASGLSLRLNSQGRYEVTYQGSVVHVAMLETGRWGVNFARLSECVTQVDSCLSSPEGKLRTVSIIDLENERRMKVNGN